MKCCLTLPFGRSLTQWTIKGLYSHGPRRSYCIDIKVPFIAESITEGIIKGWNRGVGDSLREDNEVCEIESDKLAVSVKAPTTGVLTALKAKEGVTVQVGDVIATMKKGEIANDSKKTSSPGALSQTEKSKPSEPATKSTPTTPAAAKEKEPAPKAADTKSRAPEVVCSSTDTRVRRVRTSPMRQRIADRLKASQNTAAMLTTFNEIDMSALIQMRETYKEAFQKKHGVKLGFMSAFAKASAHALQEVPIINAAWEDQHIAYHDYVDISVAVATPTGLVVPVLRDVQDMSFADIEKKIVEYGEKAKNKQLTMAEMSGGTFTISNGGVFGSWMGTPIINPPQSAILGMHATKKKPWVDSTGNLVVRPIMIIALTYDHRIIDGRDAVVFLVKIKNLIEDPHRLILDLA